MAWCEARQDFNIKISGGVVSRLRFLDVLLDLVGQLHMYCEAWPLHNQGGGQQSGPMEKIQPHLVSSHGACWFWELQE